MAAVCGPLSLKLLRRNADLVVEVAYSTGGAELRSMLRWMLGPCATVCSACMAAEPPYWSLLLNLLRTFRSSMRQNCGDFVGRGRFRT
jgi:hypothetical protein